jgi:hypothetical protein
MYLRSGRAQRRPLVLTEIEAALQRIRLAVEVAEGSAERPRCLLPLLGVS